MNATLEEHADRLAASLLEAQEKLADLDGQIDATTDFLRTARGSDSAIYASKLARLKDRRPGARLAVTMAKGNLKAWEELA